MLEINILYLMVNYKYTYILCIDVVNINNILHNTHTPHDYIALCW